MLTAELLTVRRRAGKLLPCYLHGPALDKVVPLAQALIDTFAQAPGLSVKELDEMVAEVTAAERNRTLVAAFTKLLQDRCEIDPPCSAESEHIRQVVFQHAAVQRRALGIRDNFDRKAVVEACAQQLGMTPDRLEASLFGDLPGAQTVTGFATLSAVALVQRYNLALAQGVLLRATSIRIDLAPAPAARMRQLFRAIKFRRLMHAVEGSASDGYRITLDGPMSLFQSTQRYGLQMALFLPTLVAGDGWKLHADVLWGKNKQRLSFELTDRDGLVSRVRDGTQELEEVTALVQAFERNPGDWKVRREARLFDIQGQAVFVPDLLFEHASTGQRVYLEAFGYWSREAVFRRVELLQQGFGHRFILAVSRKLRVSDQIADESFPGRILVYAQSIPVASVRKILEQEAGLTPTLIPP